MFATTYRGNSYQHLTTRSNMWIFIGSQSHNDEIKVAATNEESLRVTTNSHYASKILDHWAAKFWTRTKFPKAPTSIQGDPQLSRLITNWNRVFTNIHPQLCHRILKSTESPEFVANSPHYSCVLKAPWDSHSTGKVFCYGRTCNIHIIISHWRRWIRYCTVKNWRLQEWTSILTHLLNRKCAVI